MEIYKEGKASGHAFLIHFQSFSYRLQYLVLEMIDLGRTKLLELLMVLNKMRLVYYCCCYYQCYYYYCNNNTTTNSTE